jgi:hypothetical protein
MCLFPDSAVLGKLNCQSEQLVLQEKDYRKIHTFGNPEWRPSNRSRTPDLDAALLAPRV